MILRNTHGYSIVELVAAIAILSMTSVIALQAITGALRQRHLLQRTDVEAAMLVRSLSLLRHDLESVVPMTFQPPNGEVESAVHFSSEERFLALSIGGQPRLPGAQDAGLFRVVWRHDYVGRQLTRQSWPVLDPLDPGVAHPEVVMLTGVQWIRFQDATGQQTQSLSLTDLPELLEVILSSDRYGELTIVVAR